MKEKIRRKRIDTKILMLSFIIVIILGVIFLFFNKPKTDMQVKEPPKTEQTVNKMTADHIPTMQPCMNNEESQCASAPSIDFWPSGNEGATNPAYDRSYGNIKEIGGKITAINGSTISLQTTNNQVYEILFPVDAIHEWNTNRSPNYKSYKVDVGDTLNIRYGEPTEQSSRTIQPSQIFTSTLAVRLIGGVDGKIERF